MHFKIDLLKQDRLLPHLSFLKYHLIGEGADITKINLEIILISKIYNIRAAKKIIKTKEPTKAEITFLIKTTDFHKIQTLTIINNTKGVDKMILASRKEDKCKISVEILVGMNKNHTITKDNKLLVIIRRDSKTKITKGKTLEDLNNKIIFKGDKGSKIMNSMTPNKKWFKEIQISIEKILEAGAEAE
jgi:hypothetical protein